MGHIKGLDLMCTDVNKHKTTVYVVVHTKALCKDRSTSWSREKTAATGQLGCYLHLTVT